jgi:ABC-type branched-subunit amino acid transport system substrate-binding protein
MPFIRAGRFLCAAAAALVFATPASAQSANTTILIGAVVDQTGGSTSPHYRAAIELAGRQMNEALAQAGSKIKFEILFGDSKSDPPFAQQEALRLINQHGVKALVGDSSGVSVALNRLNYDPASQAKGKVAITCFQCSSSFINDPEVTESDPQVQAAERDLDGWLFRVFYVAKFEASALAQIALKRANKGDGPLKVGIFADGGHRALATDLAKALPSFHKGALSVEIVYLSARDKIAAEWPTVVDDKDAAGKTDGPPDVVIVAMLPDPAALAIKAYREAGYSIPLLSNNSFRRDYQLKALGALANGVEGSSVTQVDKGPSGQAFVAAFSAAIGETPEMTSSGAYDAAVTLMLAALIASGDGKEATAEDIRAGLGKINDPEGRIVRPTVADFAAAAKAAAKGEPINYEGAFHAINWDARGDMFPPLVHWKIENGQFVEYELYACSRDQPNCPGL